MSVVIASDLVECSGVHLSSTNSVHACPQVPDEEAVTGCFIPADGCSAILVSPHRILVTGGVLSDDRVLPFTVLRYLDLDPGPTAEHRWVKPILLRVVSKRGKRKRGGDGSTIPVCRIDHSLTLVPEVAQLFLIGGLKVGGKDEGTACKSMFSLDTKTRLWESVQVDQPGRSKAEQEHVLGPCLAHVAVYMHTLKTGNRDRKSSGYILVHGGYVSTADLVPRSQLNVFDVRLRRWSLRSAEQGIPPPQRAYHAAAATESCRYLVVHGGSCSHINEPTFMSSDLFVFDMVKSEWFRPKLLPTSADPPAARSRHCLVNGIGKHEGSFVMFGGFVATGESSSDMFLLTIIEPVADDQQVCATWEKVNIMAPERPLQNTGSLSQPEQQLHLKYAHSPAIAGGCLIPVSAINKYLVVGGRGPYGIRNAPLLLDAASPDYLDRLDPVMVNASTRVARVDTRATGSKPSAMEIKARLRIKPPAPSVSKLVLPDHIKENITIPLKRQRSRLPLLPSRTSPSPPTVSLRPQISSLQSSQGDMSPVAIPQTISRRRNYSKLANRVVVESAGRQPTKAIRHTSAVNVRINKPTNGRGDIELDLVDDGDNLSLSKDNQLPVLPGSDDMETPPMKRRRFIEGARKKSLGLIPESNGIIGSDEREMPDSAGSDFVAASEIAKKAVSRVGKSSRGKGRGRKRGTGRGRAMTVAEERETVKAREAEEALRRENENLVKQLSAENSNLLKEKEALKKDNHDLNEQMKSLLSEVQTLRACKRLQGANHDNSSSKGNDERLANVNRTRQNLSVELSTFPGLVSPELPEPKDLAELNKLRSRINDLQEECQETALERDSMSKSLRTLEDNKRTLEMEFNTFKNKSERIEIERDQLRRQASELRTAFSTANASQETTKETIRRMELTISSLRRELESAQYALKSAESRQVEEKLQLSNAQRQMSDAKGQLTEASKRYEQFHLKERQLLLELESQRDMLSEIKESVYKTTEANSKLKEKNIELMAELDRAKADLNKKLTDCSTALQETERARSALDCERERCSDLDVEASRLKHELRRSEKKYHALTKRVRKKESLLRSLGPSVTQITKVLGVLMDSSQEDESGCTLLETSRANIEAVDGCGGSMDPSNNAPANPTTGVDGHNLSEVVGRDGSHHIVNDATAKESQDVTAGSANRSQRNEGSGMEEGGDAKSPVPPSDEGDEP